MMAILILHWIAPNYNKHLVVKVTSPRLASMKNSFDFVAISSYIEKCYSQKVIRQTFEAMDLENNSKDFYWNVTLHSVAFHRIMHTLIPIKID